MNDEKLVGSLNLARLTNVGIMTIKGQTSNKKCVVIPIEDNDIYVKVEEKTDKQGNRYVDRKYSIGIEIYESRETDQYGNTHYIKPSTSKEYIRNHSQADLDARNKMYLGNLHPVAIPSSNQAGTVEAPPAEAVAGEDEDLPF